MDEEIRKQNEFLKNILKSLTHPFYVINVNDYSIVMANPAAKPGGLKEKTTCYALTHKSNKPCGGTDYPCPMEEVKKTKQPVTVKHTHYDKKGNIRKLKIYGYPIFDGKGNVIQMIEYALDITEHDRLEKQFLQSQKMEAVGRLAGGVAHDFNNLMTVIIGYSEILLMNPTLDNKNRYYIEQIKSSGDSAASLTQQLLAFSRKQILQPKVVNLNKLAADIKKMLTGIIGEDIELFTTFEPELGMIRADPAQIEQVIVNLGVNARDAMPGGGKLTIETKNVYLDGAYCASHASMREGWYIMLAVSDTGQGMDEETKKHIFEPFFTTKEKGKGTGLGLATVYGIVKQNGGHIWIYSELNEGTTFKVYFPRIDNTDKEGDPGGMKNNLVGGHETILLVDDEEVVRNMIATTLKTFGYTVLQAESGEEALQIYEQSSEKPIHLMITDVVMPGMSGYELVKQLSKKIPDIKVLYISGYTDNTIVHHGMLNKGLHFLQKPFTPNVLAEKVREVLDS